MRELLSIYSPRLATYLVYMLQNVEYEVNSYLAWFWRTKDFNTVMYRRTLERTKAAKTLVAIIRLGIVLQLVAGAYVVYNGYSDQSTSQVLKGLIIILSYPVVWAHLITLPLLLGRALIIKPRHKRLVAKSTKIFKDHPGVVIAVAGSYGKTTVKELLLTILAEGKKVAATPANKNVAVSHARFAHKLTGNEDILVIEYGEGQPGDVAKFAKTTRPDIGVITGLAPAHLDKYKTLDAAAKDIMSLASFVKPEALYVNADSEPLRRYIKDEYTSYTSKSVAGWKVSDIQLEVDGTSFKMQKGKRKLALQTKLVGRHLIGPVALCVAIAADMGLTDQQITDGVAKTEPFEHRMQPRLLAGGWIIDDTYNGNLEGIRAGLGLLSDLTAKRKVYVTPGLVDQGKESNRVHEEVGVLIAQANPNKVVLMKNSATESIKKGLKTSNYDGELIVEDDPLNFYSNLDQFIAVGDVVLMQNDWTDNYN